MPLWALVVSDLFVIPLLSRDLAEQVDLVIAEGSSTTQGCFEICQMLIQAGAVGNLTSADTAYGRTAAHWAVHYRQHQILDLLIQAGKCMRVGRWDGMRVGRWDGT